MGHVVCEDGIKVDLYKIKVIFDLNPPINPKQVRTFLGHTGYYRKFKRHYSDITYHMQEFQKINLPLIWNQECT